MKHTLLDLVYLVPKYKLLELAGIRVKDVGLLALDNYLVSSLVFGKFSHFITWILSVQIYGLYNRYKRCL